MEEHFSPDSLDINNIVEHWAGKPLPDWKREGKISAPRICLARLHLRNTVDEVNEYLLSQKPWSGNGSSWLFHRGDYDFAMVPLIS